MNAKLLWRVFLVAAFIFGSAVSTHSVKALGTPQIISVSPASPQPVGTRVTVHARVDTGGDFRSMRICFGSLDYCQEDSSGDETRTFDTSNLSAPHTYWIIVQADSQGDNWSNAVSIHQDYTIADPQPSKGPTVSSISMDPSGGQVAGNTANIHVRISDVPGSVTVDVSCGGVSKHETTEQEFDTAWVNTGGCSGSEKVTVTTRAADDPNWSNTTKATKSYNFSAPAAPVNVPSVSFSADSTSIQSGNCTYLHWQTSGADNADIDGTQVNLNGDKKVCPSVTKKYTLSAHNSAGTTNRNISVTVSASPQQPAQDPSQYFNPGDVIKIGDQIYVIVRQGGGIAKAWVPNPATKDALGISDSMINNKGFSNEELSLINDASDIPAVEVDPAGEQSFKNQNLPYTTPITGIPNETTGNSNSGNGNCSIQSLVTSPDSPALPGTQVTIGFWGSCSQGDVHTRIYIDGAYVTEQSASPTTWVWNTTNYSLGTHTIRVAIKNSGAKWNGAAYQEKKFVLSTSIPPTAVPSTVPTQVPTEVPTQTASNSAQSGVDCGTLAQGQWWNPFNPPEVGATEQCVSFVNRVDAAVNACWNGAYPDGGLWDDWARDPKRSGKCGWTVNPSDPNGTANFSQAQPGDIITWNPGYQNGNRSCANANFDHGHVAIFKGMNPDGTIRVSESNWDRDHNKVPVDPTCMSVIHTNPQNITTPTQPVDKCSQFSGLRWVWCKLFGS